MKNILVLCCGGTLSMQEHTDGSLDITKHASPILDLDERIHQIANITIHEIANINSSNADSHLRIDTGEKIAQHYHEFDGFVITTGTDTMAYFSSALSFSLQQLGKPVVLTGAQIPLNVISSDGRNNFINALRVATMNLCGVFLVFGTKIICGCRATKVGESELEAFESYHTHPYGSIGIGIRLNEENITCTQDSLILKNGFSENIMSINMFPGIKNSHLMHLLDAGIAGFILKGYGTGDVPDYIFPFLREAQKRNIPIVQATQCRGTTILGIYSIGKEALACGVIEAYDMSLEAITTKLMRSLHQQLSYEQIKSSMHTNIAGELDTTKALFYKD